MSRVFAIIISLIFVVGTVPTTFAYDRDAVRAIYDVRPDLQAAFDENGVPIPGSAAGFLIDIYDWAQQYGWREHPGLAEYAPTSQYVPERISEGAEPEVTATSYVIIDKNSGQILAAKEADAVWPVASLTKLATAKTVLANGIDLTGIWSIKDYDDVGGAKLYVEDGVTLTIDDLFYSTLVGSANNAANALARATGLEADDFILAMNRLPFELGLSVTKFVDPTGIELGNISTAREMARLAGYVFQNNDVRRYTTTAIRYIDIPSQGIQKRLKNTNWMLYYPEYDDVYVTAGKTGYLIESGWNLVVQLRPSANEEEKELLMVLFGSGSRPDSFADAKRLATWTWQSHKWRLSEEVINQTMN